MRKKNIESNNAKLRELGLCPIPTSNFKKPENPWYVALNPSATDLITFNVASHIPITTTHSSHIYFVKTHSSHI